jgi:SNF2 family DNA or RNA helicase
MTTPLLRHQRLALAWMSRRESGAAQPIGGILADDQGLGKTVTTIALIACNPRHGQQLVALPPLRRAGSDEGGNSAGAGAGPSAAREGGGGGREAEEGDEEIIEIDLSESERGKLVPASGSSLAEGATLVVCPTTVLHQWEQEVRSKTNASANLNVYVYHGKGAGIGNIAVWVCCWRPRLPHGRARGNSKPRCLSSWCPHPPLRRISCLLL